MEPTSDTTAAGAITDVPGIACGHHTLSGRPTGCTVVLAGVGAVCGVDVRGHAPGTRETDLLSPLNLVDRVQAVLLAGGSAFGLDAAAGVVRWLESRGLGFPAGPVRVPIVPAAVLFDLWLGDPTVRPDAHAGHSACEAAAAAAERGLAPAEGNVGAGAGATVGKALGPQRAMKGGIGMASLQVAGCTVGAIVACNALGDIVDPDRGRVIAGARSADGRTLADARRALLAGAEAVPALGQNTTIGVVATDAPLTRLQATQLARVAHDGLARAINPVHTPSDGDTMFVLSTHRSATAPTMLTLSVAVAEVTVRAVLRAAWAAEGLRLPGLWLPAARDLARPPVGGDAAGAPAGR